MVTANADGYAAALELIGAGTEVAAIVDLRPERVRASRSPTQSAIMASACWQASRPSRPSRRAAIGMSAASSRRRIDALRARPRRAGRHCDCDLVLMAPGFTPAASASLAGGRQLSPTTTRAQCSRSAAVPNGISVAGSLNGAYALGAVLAEGEAAGHAAAAALGLDAGTAPAIPTDRGERRPVASLADLPASEGQGLRRFRRGHAGRRTSSTPCARATTTSSW